MMASLIGLILLLMAMCVYLAWEVLRLRRQIKENAIQLQNTIKDLKIAQVKLVETGKVSAVAALSAGILHQISQPITAIHGFVKFMKKEMEPSSPFYKPVCIMDEQSTYIKQMLENLMDLVRHRQIQKTRVNINTVLAKSISLISDELRIRRIGWDLTIDEQAPDVFADALHLQQVFMNLVVNAMQALGDLPHGCPRTLEIFSRYDQKTHVVEICFKDNGPGIDPANIKNIFDPFFTTKPEGSGIGLALCQDLVSEHGGTIRAQSDGYGTQMIVVLPCMVNS